MPPDSKSTVSAEAAVELTPEEARAAERKAGIQAYHDARSPAEKAAAVKKYPFLAQIYSAGNHS